MAERKRLDISHMLPIPDSRVCIHIHTYMYMYARTVYNSQYDDNGRIRIIIFLVVYSKYLQARKNKTPLPSIYYYTIKPNITVITIFI